MITQGLAFNSNIYNFFAFFTAEQLEVNQGGGSRLLEKALGPDTPRTPNTREAFSLVEEFRI